MTSELAESAPSRATKAANPVDESELAQVPRPHNYYETTPHQERGYDSTAHDRLVPESNAWRPQSSPTTYDDDDVPASDNESAQDPGAELTDINRHTKSIEFHGRTSSMAFLARVQTQNQGRQESSPGQQSKAEKPSLVSTLHNVAFSPVSHIPSTVEEVALQDEGYYFRQSRMFLDGYFENLHFIHPILDKEGFHARCEDLWFGRSDRQSRSFIALYYSIMSLGALVRVWDEDTVEGMNRFQWSRKLFHQARLTLGEMRATNDLETVQCLIFMAKVCQNELNPHLAYMYLGMAVRAGLSTGINREPISNSKSNNPDRPSSESKTWWGLYSLEVEMSFALGRPDTLGMDDYHNRRLPPIDDSETAILPCMVEFARITRKVSVAIYLSKSSMRDKMSLANNIEAEMDAWLTRLPEKIRPYQIRDEKSLRILKDPKWARRQRLVTQLRYCNVKMVLYRPFLVYASRTPRRLPVALESTVAKCVNAAKETTEIMYDTFRHHVFFRTWWYNTTYTLYAASIILCYITQAAPSTEKPALFRLVDMTIEILEAMDESVVAKKAGEIIKQTLSHAREHTGNMEQSFSQEQPSSRGLEQEPRANSGDLNFDAMLDSQIPPLHSDSILDFDETSLVMDDTQFLFWNDLSGAVGGFGSELLL
jgi:Fungal specific transcription factor domain